MIPIITVSSSIHNDAWNRMYMFGMAMVVLIGLKCIKKGVQLSNTNGMKKRTPDFLTEIH